MLFSKSAKDISSQPTIKHASVHSSTLPSPNAPLSPANPNIGPDKGGQGRRAQKPPKGNLFGRAHDKLLSLSNRAKILLFALLIVILFPSVTAVIEGYNAYVLYSQVRSALDHLQTAQNLFSGDHGNPARYFDVNKLRQAQVQVAAAHSDFMQLSDEFDHDGSIGLLNDMLPQQINTARSLVHIGADATAIGQQLIGSAIKLAPSLAPALSHPLEGSDNTSGPLKPYLTPAAFNELFADINFMLPFLHDMTARSQHLALDSLPLNARQNQLLTSFLKVLPDLDTTLTRLSSLKNEVGWLLGIDQPRTFLVEPMDTAELRATGGFTGQFGDLTLNGGHMAPLKLQNIGLYEEDHTAEGSPPDYTIYKKVVGQTAPAPYSSWWPVANFGMRDANLSADFPTSAKLIMNRYQYEFGQQLDGVIIFTPQVIEDVLQATGPIYIANYNETITAQNLVDRLHYYQLNNAGIRKEEIIEHVDDGQQARKLFTQRVTHALMATVQHLPLDKLSALVKEIFAAMKTKDLQIYVTNPQVEALIGKYGSTASLDRSTNHDGLFVVQSNLSASKASQYVTTTMKDTVTLDASGGATHHLQMTLDYQKQGDVYGFDTYRDYVRVYVPPTSKFIAGNGFAQQNEPYCSANSPAAGYRPCPLDVYGDGSLVCATSPEAGYSTWLLDDPYFKSGQPQPLVRIGPPTNMVSDEVGRDMYAGWLIIPPDCTLNATLSWYVPASSHPYSLLVQAQAGILPHLDLTIQPAPGSCSAGKSATINFSDVLNGEDRMFTATC
jgi:hypothetical protein